MFKKFVQQKLEGYVRRYFIKHPEVKLIIVAGSVGKTSTKRSIATLLSQKYRVALHEGNHNTHLSAPLAILGIEYPDNIKNPLAWLRVFMAARERINSPSGTDVIIQEVGADRIGDIAHFGTYLKPYIGVVTAVTPEHMEFFGTIEAVAAEELTAANIAQIAIINRDDIEGRFAQYLTNGTITTYGTTAAAEYRFEQTDYTIAHGFTGSIIGPSFTSPIAATIQVSGEHSLRPVMAAVAVAATLGLTPEEIAKGVTDLRPVPGRMNILKGIDGTIVIDDSYNSSPAAAEAALRELYKIQAPERVAILGSMNELGESSAREHEILGMMCDPAMLSWVVTIGSEAEKYLAPAARKRGCQVKSFRSSIDAGGFVRSITESGAVILVKGSQGDVYAEEAVKVLCLMDEEPELVRQSEAWMKIKEEFFSKFA